MLSKRTKYVIFIYYLPIQFIAVMSTFSVEQIRQKYRKILDQNESEDLQKISSKPLITIKKNSGVKRFLTEHNENISSSKDQNQNNNILLALKERVAQGIQNMNNKQDEIQAYREKIIKQQAQISVLQSQLSQFKDNIQKNSVIIVQEKVGSATLQKEILKLQKQLHNQNIQKDMVYKQIEFYKEEIRNLKVQKQSLHSHLENQKNDIQKIDRLQNQNNRLRDNIKRLQEIIDQCFKEKKSINFQNKYYLGKPFKQANSWFSQNLVGEIEHFLAKWQIGHLNREFINSLVKFIDCRQSKINNKEKRKGSSKTKKSHLRTFSKDHFLSDSNFLGISITQAKKNDLSLKKSLKLKDIKIDKKMQKRLSLLYEEKGKNITNGYESIFSEYQNALNLALTTSDIKPKQIISLNNELKSLLKDYLTANFDKHI